MNIFQAAMAAYSDDLFRLGLSLVLGSIVGLEREFNEKPAGLKTNVLICLGSTLFTILSERAFQNTSLRDFHIAAQIVTGIGFLGAGAIMRDGERVTGLTTAAVIWVVAAIGMSLGMGYYALAVAAAACTIMVQLCLVRLDILMDGLRQRRTFKIVCAPKEEPISYIGEVFKKHRVRVMDRKVMKKNGLYYSEWWAAGPSASLESVARELLQSGEIAEVAY